MLPLRVYVALASLCVWGVHGATELLQNPGFENGISNWLHDGFTMTADTSQKHGGTTSAKCTGRSQNWMGPAQMVTVKPGGRYAFSLWVRLISDLPGSMYQTAAVKINFKWKDTGADDYFPVTSRNFIRAADGWVQVGADFVVPNREYNSAKIYVEGFAANVDYYVDDATLTEIPENTNWKAEADQRIENLRKSNIQFK